MTIDYNMKRDIVCKKCGCSKWGNMTEPCECDDPDFIEILKVPYKERNFDGMIGKVVRHFKGNKYLVLGKATRTETEEELVIYKALYGDYKVYARPLDMFMSLTDTEKHPEATQKYRMELIEE